MTVPREVDVTIVGGGPAGLFMALDLDARGVSSVVIEPRVTIDPSRPRAKTTSARTMTHLRRLGLAAGLRELAPLSADYSEDVAFCTSLSGYELRRFRHAFQTYRERYDLQPECGQQAPQPTVETLLRAAVERAGHAELVTGWRAVDVVAEADRGAVVVVEADRTTGSDRQQDVRLRATVRSQFVVGADGSRSVVRERAGIVLEGESAPRSNLNVVFRSRRLAEAISMAPALHYWVVGQHVGGIVGRLDLDDTWWAMLQGVAAHQEPQAAAMIEQLAGTSIDVELVESDPWTARMMLANAFSKDRIHLIGDAAHLNPPWGGHGFNTAIGDAANLAWKIAAVMQGWGGPGLLESYEAERRPIAAQTISDAAANGNALAVDFAHPRLGEDTEEGARLREEVRQRLDVKEPEFHSAGLVLGYHYAGSPVVASDDIPPHDPIDYRPRGFAGGLLPHAWLADGTSLYDALEGNGFTVLISGDEHRVDDVQAHLASGPGAQRTPVSVLSVSPDDVERGSSASAWGASLVLVRPDQHIAWRGEDVTDLAEALSVATGRARRTPVTSQHNEGGPR